MRRRRHHRTSHIARRASRCRGFTLIEAALTTVIVGTGVLAIVAAQQAYHIKNGWAQRTGTAMLLANELREMTVGMTLRESGSPGPESNERLPSGKGNVQVFDDLDDFADPAESTPMFGRMVFGGGEEANPDYPLPINAMGEPIPDMEAWRQVIEVGNVSPTALGAAGYTAPLATDTGMMRVTVTIFYRDEMATTLSWAVPE